MPGRWRPPRPSIAATPRFRYQPITINADAYTWKAFIKDLLAGESKLIKVGDMSGDGRLVDISVEKMSVRLKPPGKPEFTVKRDSSPAK